jgi:transcription initiation factor TFIID subunit 5
MGVVLLMYVGCLCCSPHGLYFASCGYDRVARVWVTSNHQPVRLLVGHLADVTVSFILSLMLCFHVTVSAVTNCYVNLLVFDVNVQCVQFHTNSHYIATGSSDRTVRLWEVSSGNCVRIMTGHKVHRHW